METLKLSETTFEGLSNTAIEAGAGTGKTKKLIDSLAELVLGSASRDPMPIEKIAAVTFTKKAAGEIKERLARRLEEEARLAAGPGRRERCEEALAGIEKAAIETIHGFAARLLRLYPLESGVAPDFKVDDGTYLAELFEEEWPKWLEGELGADASRREPWLSILRDCDLEELAILAKSMACEKFDKDALRRPAESVAREIAALARRIEETPFPESSPRGRKSRAPELARDLAGCLRDLAAAAQKGTGDGSRESCEARMAGLGSSAVPRQSFNALPERVPSGLEESQERLLGEALRVCRTSSAAGENRLRLAIALLDPFVERLRWRLDELGWVSFDGLLLKARNLLRDHLSVREEIKKRYDVFLVDEFQDTDPLQGEILFFLAETPGGAASRWDLAVPAPGRLVIVGDPKQSIYRFRGADMLAYQRFTAKLLDCGGKSETLDVNYRSPEPMLQAVNAIFSRIMSEDRGLQCPYQPLRGAKPATKGEDPVEFAVVEDGANAASGRKAQAAWISRWIVEHCGEGRRRLGDVALLFRSASALPEFVSALRESGIPYVSESERGFFAAPELGDVVNVLRSISEPEDIESLCGILRSPLIALSDAELLRLARAGTLDFRRELPEAILADEESSTALRSLFLILRGLHDLARRAPLAILWDAAFHRLRLPQLLGAAYHGEQTAANLAKLRRLALETGLGAGAFADLILHRRREGIEEGESALADERYDAVRLLTIHKAKGLQFPVVFVPNVQAPPGGGQEKPSILHDWGLGVAGLRLGKEADAAMALLESREKARGEGEVVRLLYVALTRAQEKLVIVGGAKPAARSFAALLDKAGAWPGAAGSLRLEGLSIPVHRLNAKAEGAAPRLQKPPDTTAAPGAASFRKLWRDRAERCRALQNRPWHVVPSAPQDGIGDRGQGEEEGKNPVSIRALGSGSLAPSALVGQLCHKVLEEWDYRQGGDIHAALHDARRRLEWSSPALAWEAASVEAATILEGFLLSAAARSLAKVEILGREIPFVDSKDGAVVRGTIDLLYRDGNALVVADYKTDRINSPEDIENKRRAYEIQGGFYLDAVEKALQRRPDRFRLIFLRAPDP